MAAHTAKRQESVRLFSSDRVCIAQKRTAALFYRICLENIKPLCVIRVRAGHVWLFSSNIYMPRMHTVVYFERACQEGVHFHIFNRVRMLKPP